MIVVPHPLVPYGTRLIAGESLPSATVKVGPRGSRAGSPGSVFWSEDSLVKPQVASEETFPPPSCGLLLRRSVPVTFRDDRVGEVGAA